jgi:hypothetical protein
MKWRGIQKRDADLERELLSDLELEEEEQHEAGVSGEEARYAALRKRSCTMTRSSADSSARVCTPVDYDRYHLKSYDK